MQIAAGHIGYLSTRVGGRTLRHFLGAALLPVLVVSALGIWSVRKALTDEAVDRVQRTAKASALILQGELATAANRFMDRPDDGLIELGAYPLTPENQEHLRDGKVLLRVMDSGGDGLAESEVQLIRRARSGILVARNVPSSMMWPVIDGLNDFERSEICVFAVATWHRIHCSEGTTAERTAELRQMAMKGSSADSVAESDGLVSAQRDLYLRFEFQAPEWRVVVAEPRAEALAAASVLTISMLVLIVLAAVCAFVFALRMIRQSTEPLAQLRDATRLVAAGDLTARVNIHSRDEYGELGTSFNQMTSTLLSKLTLLQHLDAVDSATLRDRQLADIAHAGLEGLVEPDGCRRAELVVIDHIAGAPMTLWCLDTKAGATQESEVHLADCEYRNLLEHDAHHDGTAERFPEVMNGTNYRLLDGNTRAALPLTHDGRMLGVLAFGIPDDASERLERLQAARRIGDRVALGIANVQLVKRLEALTLSTLATLARAIDANSPWTAGHSERVTKLSLRLGQQLRLSRDEMSALHRGGLLHDIGKISIPHDVLNKPGKLTDDEFRLIQQHPEIGERILKPIPVFADVLPVVRSHHEKLDGTGYPDRLAGDDIPWLARVLAVADVFDALVSDRPYRAGLSVRAAMTIITGDSGTHFDPRVVEAMKALNLDEKEQEMPSGQLSGDPSAGLAGEWNPFVSPDFQATTV